MATCWRCGIRRYNTLTLAVILLTYASSVDSPRHRYGLITAHSLVENLRYSGGIHWHIADDGSPPECIQEFQFPGGATVTVAQRKGYGASYNLATQALHINYDYFLVVEDDWQLVRELNIDPLIKALDDGLNCIRLGYLGWTQELRGKFAKYADQTFLEIDPGSEEPHVWAGHPRLEKKSFQREVGIWPEGVDPGTTEFMVSQRDESRHGIAWPLDIGMNASQQWANTFCHIGAVQARDDQNG